MSKTTDDLITTQEATEIMGLQFPSAFRYHVRQGNIKAKEVITTGKFKMPRFSRKEVEALRDEIASRTDGKRGRPKISDTSGGKGKRGRAKS